jgi:threonine/homoserine/homoserine lactone efflux protein
MNVVLMALTFAFIGTLSAGTWALFGTTLRRLLRSSQAVRVFNIIMALLLVASLYPLFAEAFQYLKVLAEKASII